MHRIKPSVYYAHRGWPRLVSTAAAIQSKSRPIQSLLIANRGEIALRVGRTAAEDGIRTTTIFTNPDAHTQHALSSEYNANLGDASAYLDGAKIIEIAKEAGCDAIHPGYGFLSENAGFAQLCDKAGIIFVGPPPEAIEAMGNKSRSKEIMTAAGVPCIPGYHGTNQDPIALAKEADKIGYPVLLKAVKGGGGKGMRIVNKPEEFAAQLESAKSESRSSFGDDVMLVEKFIGRPRHIEVQIFADQHGNCVALGERDCSIQRRHQKILEESPAPGLAEHIREDLWAKARDAALAVGYRGAGTVEFIFDNDSGEFFFMEMNTRLQVEHPVSEMVTGTDLVRWQIEVAEGKPLPLTQEQIKENIAARGHAIEARIYAESPERNFVPDSGRLVHVREPQTQPDSVRIDSGFTTGDEISAHYDPMIAKLIVRGSSREEALQKMRTALEQYQIAGPATNIDFLQRVCASKAFADADLDTGFISKYRGELFVAREVPAEVFAQAALSVVLQNASNRQLSSTLGTGTTFGSHELEIAAVDSLAVDGSASLTRRTVQVRPSSSSRDKFDITVSGTDISTSSFSGVSSSLSRTLPSRSPVEIMGDGDNAARLENVSKGGASKAILVDSFFPTSRFATTVVPLKEPFSVIDPELAAASSVAVFHRGLLHRLAFLAPKWHSERFSIHTSGPSGSSAGSGVSLSAEERARMVLAPMPCKVLRVEVNPGDIVEIDQPVAVVESMKMEMVIRASRAGKVSKIVVGAGEMCKAGGALVEFDKEE